MIFQSSRNMDQLFRDLPVPAIIINDIPLRTEQDRVAASELIRSEYTSDMVSLLPRCRCGATVGGYNIVFKTVCQTCGGLVTKAVTSDIDTNLWFRRPGRWDHESGAFYPVTEKLIHPKILMMLLDRFQRKNYNIIQYLIDRNYSTSSDNSLQVMKIREVFPERGYNYFVRNFREIIHRLFTDRNFKPPARRVDALRDFIFNELDKDNVFFDHLPIPNRCIRVVEPTVTCTFVERTVLDSISAINLLVSIDRDYHDQSSLVKESRVARAMIQMANYYAKYNADIIDKTKRGTMRRQTYSTRSPWTMRTVITSKAGIQSDRKIKAPWGAVLAISMYEIINILTNRMGYTSNDARGLIYNHMGRYHPLLDHIVNDILIPESVNNQIDVLANRNPSLMRSSITHYGIGSMKTNPRDATTEQPICDCALFNADFDGDQMNYTKATDNFMAHQFKAFAVHRNAFGMFKPHQVTGFFDIPKPSAAATASWLTDANERNMR